MEEGVWLSWRRAGVEIVSRVCVHCDVCVCVCRGGGGDVGVKGGEVTSRKHIAHQYNIIASLECIVVYGILHG